jgi:hypothetical protein
MFPVPPFVVIIYLVVYAVAGMAIGALTGWVVSVTTSGSPGLLKDAFLGSFGFVAGFFAAIFMPWHRNTISYHLPGGTLVESTMNTYQHPEWVAIAFAILLPVLHELYCWRKRSAT